MSSFIDALKMVAFPIHKEGYKFIFIFAFVTIIAALLSDFLGLVGLVATLWCVFFFRDPVRILPKVDGAVISPADGVVTKIEQDVAAPTELEIKGKKFTKISVFLNVFNVHVNRVPFSGVIEKVVYVPGKFLSANIEDASEENERNIAHLKTSDNKDIIFSQVAGLVARRIVSELKDKQEVKAGDKYGIIRFGSRMDIYLPKGTKVITQVGQTMIGGETIIANI